MVWGRPDDQGSCLGSMSCIVNNPSVSLVLPEYLDTGNNKKAVQEADKIIRKQPKLATARALKALALLRLGRAPECEELLKQVFFSKIVFL